MIRVLIVDDDKLARLGLITMLPWAEYGMEVVGEAANGKAALEFLLLQPVDLMFVDLAMPVMSGLDLMRRCSRLYPHLRFVVTTFHEDFTYVQTALRLGALDYISKIRIESEDYNEIFRSILAKLQEPEEQPVDPKVWSESIARWDTLYWIYDDCLFAELCAELRCVGASVRLVENLFSRLLAKMDGFCAGLEKPVVAPALSSVDDAVGWIAGYRLRLRQDAARLAQTGSIELGILKAIAIVKENPGGCNRTDAVAADIHMSRSYFSSSFKQLTGMTFHSFLRRERINRGAQLLVESNQPVPVIASQVGYEDEKYFSQIFHEQMGASPDAYRRKRRSATP